MSRILDSTVLRRKLPIPGRETFYGRHGRALDWFYLVALGAWALAAPFQGKGFLPLPKKLFRFGNKE